MDYKKVGMLIRSLRVEQKMTQRQLAEQMNISDKTISKWERGAGCPDVSLLPELSGLLGVSIEKILGGDLAANAFIGGNMKNTDYYVCPFCGNLLFSTGKAEIFCCGRKLEPLTAKKAEAEEKLHMEQVEDEWFITSDHPMRKENYISFVALASGGKIHIVKQYPQWDLQVRFPKREHGKLLWYSRNKGLLYQIV